MEPERHPSVPSGGRPLRVGLGLAIVALALVWGLVELFDLRFASGDVYPYASSSRADPLGSKAFHDALAELPGMRVERNLRPLERLEVGPATTVLLLGVEPWILAEGDPELLFTAEALAGRGARVVIAFRPVERAPLGVDDDAAPRRRKSDDAQEKPADPQDAKRGGVESPRGRDAKAAAKSEPEPWGFTARWSKHERQGAAAPLAEARREPRAAAELPPTLPVRSVLAFGDPTAIWTEVYGVGGDAVWLERRVGAGSIAVAADGYPFSNEALLLERQPALLAWAIGDAATAGEGAGERLVIFDESHLGVQEEGGVMVLARRYHLHAVIGVLLLLALLFVWRAAATLVEPAPGVDRHLVEGGDAAAGLARLLGRGIAARAVLGVAAERWARDCGRGHEAAAKAARGVAAASADAVSGYAAVRAALAEHAPRLVRAAAAPPTSPSLLQSASLSRKEDHVG